MKHFLNRKGAYPEFDQAVNFDSPLDQLLDVAHGHSKVYKMG